MKSENYKKIAEIIKEELNTSKGLNYRERSLIDGLADYFEEESRKDIFVNPLHRKFNKTQFLKLAGVQ